MLFHRTSRWAIAQMGSEGHRLKLIEMKKLIVLSFPLFIITIILTITHVIVSNLLSTAGVELDRLQSDLILFQKENTVLREKVLSDTSLLNIASSAAEMGFIDTKTNLYLPDQLPIARR